MTFTPERDEKMKESIKNVTGFILFVIGAALMICGFCFTEEPSLVLQKAITICLECVGIG